MRLSRLLYRAAARFTGHVSYVTASVVDAEAAAALPSPAAGRGVGSDHMELPWIVAKAAKAAQTGASFAVDPLPDPPFDSTDVEGQRRWSTEGAEVLAEDEPHESRRRRLLRTAGGQLRAPHGPPRRLQPPAAARRGA